MAGGYKGIKYTKGSKKASKDCIMREVDNNYNVTKEKIGLYKDSGDF